MNHYDSKHVAEARNNESILCVFREVEEPCGVCDITLSSIMPNETRDLFDT